MYKGEERSKRVGVDAAPAACPGATGAAHLPASSWYCRQVSEGTQGPIASAFARQRVTLCKEGRPARTVWLVLKRTVGAPPLYASSISNAPVSTPWRTFVWLSGVRWAMEQCFEEGKTARGLEHYEVRKYTGWHQQMLTTMLAPCFWWHLKLRLGKKSARPHGLAAPHDLGRRLTSAPVYDCRGAGVGRVGAKASLPSVSGASGAATRGRLTR